MGARGIIKGTEMLFTGSLSNFLAPYICRKDGRSKEQLKNKVLSCKSAQVVKKIEDIEWSCGGDCK